MDRATPISLCPFRLKKPMEFQLHVSPVVKSAGDPITTDNPQVNASMSGKVSSFATKADLIKRVNKLELDIGKLKKENEALKKQNKELQQQLGESK